MRVGVFGYGCGLFGGSVGVLRKQGKDSSLVKIFPQLPGCDRLCPVRREVGKPPPALLDGHTLPTAKAKLKTRQSWLAWAKVPAVSSGAASPCPFQTWWAWSAVRRLLWRHSLYQGQAALSSAAQYSRSVTPFLAAVQEVDLVKPLPVAHLHDFTLEIFHSGVWCSGACMPSLRVRWSVHVGQKRDFINPQGVDDDMHMDIARCGYARPGGCRQGLGVRGNALCRTARPAPAPGLRSSRCLSRPVGQS